MAIELKNITKTFVERTWRTTFLRKTPKRVEALRGVSLSVRPGVIFGLLGPNGAGKTTLIKILATLILPDSGHASILGHDLCDHAQQVRTKIGVVNTSERSFYWRLTGRQNLIFFAALCNLSGSKGRKRIEELLDLVGLNEKADNAFMRYSTGQQQRLALARALLADPEVLLMDEPTRSLDPVAASDLRRFTIKELAERQGKTVLWCTHNLKEAGEVCGCLAIIHKGKVIASGSHSMRCDQSSAGKRPFISGRIACPRWPCRRTWGFNRSGRSETTVMWKGYSGFPRIVFRFF